MEEVRRTGTLENRIFKQLSNGGAKLWVSGLSDRKGIFFLMGGSLPSCRAFPVPSNENVDQSICFLERSASRLTTIVDIFHPCSSQRSCYVAGISVSIEIPAVLRTLWGKIVILQRDGLFVGI